MSELFDTSGVWTGIEDDGTETEYRTLMVFTTDCRDALYILYTNASDEDCEDMEVLAMKFTLSVDTEFAVPYSIETEEDKELVSHAFERFRRCSEYSRALEFERAADKDATCIPPRS